MDGGSRMRPTKPVSPTSTFDRFRGDGAKYQVSRDGGAILSGGRMARSCFISHRTRTLMAVSIDATDQFDIGVPQALFPTAVPRLNAGRVYAVTKDGKRFLVNARPQQASAESLTVVINWPATIQR